MILLLYMLSKTSEQLSQKLGGHERHKMRISQTDSLLYGLEHKQERDILFLSAVCSLGVA